METLYSLNEGEYLIAPQEKVEMAECSSIGPSVEIITIRPLLWHQMKKHNIFYFCSQFATDDWSFLKNTSTLPRRVKAWN